jgi:hypothetical protein
MSARPSVACEELDREGVIHMKPIVIVGIILAVLGAVVLFTGGLGYASHRSMMSVGDLHVSAEQQRVVPPWVGGVAIVGGLLLVGAGVRERSAG